MALTLVSPSPPATYAAIAAAVGLSTSEAHACVRRLRTSGLVDGDRRVRREALLDFLEHGVRVVFPATPASMALGFPTGAAAFPGVEGLPEPEPRGTWWVWPSPAGTTRGLSMAPLYPTLPEAVSDDDWLRQTLAAIDLLRAGRAREIRWARTELARRLGSAHASKARLDLAAPDALRAVFTRRRLQITIRRWIRERGHPLIEHPLVRPVLAEYADELSQDLGQAVPAGDFRPSPAIHIVGDKQAAGVRDWSFPSFIDGLVGRRLIDELEPHLRGNDQRTFVARARTSSLAEPGEYRLGSEWRAYVDSLPAAASGMAVSLKMDIQEFFASIDHVLARQIVAQRSGAHPRVIQLLFSLLRSWLPPGRLTDRGLPVEPHDVSRLVAHAMLRTVDDEFEDGFDLRYRRFMDDTLVFVEREEDLVAVKERHRRALVALGLAPNEQKTRVARPEEVLDEHRDPALEGLAAEPDAGWDLYAIRDFLSPSPLALRRQRWLNGLAARSGAGPQVVDHAIRQLELRPLFASALALLEQLPLGERAVRELQRRALGSDTSVEGRLQLVGALSRAPVDGALGPELAAWAWDALDRVEAPVRVPLLLTLFKHGVPDDAERVARWAAEPERTGTWERSTCDLLVRAWRGPSEAVRWSPSDPDSVWAHRLLADVESGRLRNPRRVLSALWARSSGRRTVRPEHLPLLRAMARPGLPWEKEVASFAGAVLGETRDPAVRAHLVYALEPDR